MASRRELILAEMVAALAGTVQVGSRIYRSRIEAFDRGELPAIVIQPVSDEPAQVNQARLQWNLNFQVALYLVGDAPDELGDPIVDDIHSKIMAADNPAREYLVDILPNSVSFDIEQGDKPVGVTTLGFVATYQTNLNNISTV